MHYVFGAYHLDPQRYELHHAGVLVPLRPKVFQVLAYLVAQHDRVVHKEELLEALWPGQFVGDVGLNTYILEVRKALGDRRPPHQYLRTVRGQGYRFVAPVEARDQAPGPAPRPAEPTLPQLDGEYKPVSVLCGGLHATAVVAAGLDPEGLYHVLQTVAGLAHAVLQAYGGTLLQQAPEGLTAVFGVPVAQEDHARRAVLAALDLQQRLAQHPTLRPPALGAELALGIGVHSGLGVVGELGPGAQRQVTVVGPPAQGARRLQQQAAPGALLVSAATYHLVHAEVQGEPCGSLALEGWPAPLLVYAVQGLVRRYAGVPRRPFRAESPLVGRQRELALLHDHLALVRAGAGQVLSLLGPPGIGKSRLLAEWRRQLPPAQVTWYAGRCLAYGQTTPYLPVRDIVQQVCGLDAGDPLETRTAAVRRRLARLGQVTEEDVALVLQVLDLPVAPAALGRLRPEARQARTFTLLGHLLLQEAQPRPLVLVVEDVHWIDPTSEAWLTALVARLAGTAVLLLLTQRPGYQAPWGTHAAVTQLALPPLHAAASQAVVAAVPGTVQLPAAQRQQLVAHGAGNPFFLEELAWHAVDHGRRPTPGPLPETVHAVVAARLDRLPPEAKALLQTAAVIGPEVPLPLLQAVAALPEAAVQQGLVHLQDAEFLDETRLFPAQEYTFKHALTHDVAYGSLLQEQRRLLHAHIVTALETLARDRLTEEVERLAHHARRGEVWAKALAYYWQAGEKAFARSALREAMACFEQALVAVEHLPESQERCEQAIDLRLAMRNALQALGALGAMFDQLCAAERLAASLDDPRRLGWVSAYLSPYFCVTGDQDRAIETGQRALAIAIASKDFALELSATHILGLPYNVLGDYRQAGHYHRKNVETLTGEWLHERLGGPGPMSVFSRVFLNWSLAELGEFAKGLVRGEEAIQIAEATVDQPYTLSIAYVGVGLLRLRKGDLPQAIPVLERSLGVCQAGDVQVLLPYVASFLGYAYALPGRLAEALPLLEQGVEQCAATKIMAHYPLLVAHLGEAYLLAGRIADASRQARQALKRARDLKQRGYEAYALRLLGEIAAQRQPPDAEAAAAAYRQAMTLADELGMRPLVAHCHLGLGTLYARTGRREEARAELSAAIVLYRTMDMAFWLPQAEAALAQVEG